MTPLMADQPTGSTGVTAILTAQLGTGVSVNRPRDHSVRAHSRVTD